MEYNALSNVEVYTQILQCPSSVKLKGKPTMDEKLHEYTENTMNDTKKQTGLLFYKASVYKEIKENCFTFTINFHMFSKSVWSEEMCTRIKDEYLKDTLNNVHGSRLIGEHVHNRTDQMKRKPVYQGDIRQIKITDKEHEADASQTPPPGSAYADEEIGCGAVRGRTICQKFLFWWFVVPQTQWRFFDLAYQVYTFDLTHYGLVPKLLHFLTIPSNTIFTMAFLAQFPFIATLHGVWTVDGYGSVEVNASLVLLLVLSCMYLLMGVLNSSYLWSVVTTAVLTVCWMAGNMWYTIYKTADNPWYNPTTWWTNPILWCYISSVVQTLSHIPVPQVPPYITGLDHWETIHLFYHQKYQTSKDRCTAWTFRCLSVIHGAVFSPILTWLSWPHLCGIEVVYIMAGIGYRRQFFKELYRVSEKAELTGNPNLDAVPTDYKTLVIPFDAGS